VISGAAELARGDGAASILTSPASPSSARSLTTGF
jgi:hypothetical protein